MQKDDEKLPLWRQLQACAAVIQAVRSGSSGTSAMETVAAPLRPGVQALAFHVWRNLGRAQTLCKQLAAKQPPPAVDALLCTALALAWSDTDAPYDSFTLVNQAVEAAKRHAIEHEGQEADAADQIHQEGDGQDAGDESEPRRQKLIGGDMAAALNRIANGQDNGRRRRRDLRRLAGSRGRG